MHRASTSSRGARITPRQHALSAKAEQDGMTLDEGTSESTPDANLSDEQVTKALRVLEELKGDTDIIEDLQSLNGPHLDTFIENILQEMKDEESEFNKTLVETREALKGFAEGGEDGGAAERVAELVHKLSIAGQPLLQRMIQTGDKDLEQLLAEMGSGSTSKQQGLPTPTTVKPTLGKQEDGWDSDDENQAKEEFIEWMKKGKENKLSEAERKEIVDMLNREDPETLKTLFDAPEAASIDTAKPLDTVETAEDDESWYTTKEPVGLSLPKTHPQTHGIPVALLHFRSHHVPLLDFMLHFTLHTAYALGIPSSNAVHLPIQRTLVTVLRSPFIHKKSQENFDRKTYKRVIKVWDADGDLVDRWINYLEGHMIGGVGMRVTRWERVPFGMGATGLLNPLPASSGIKDKVMSVGDEIIRKESDVHLRTSNTESASTL